MDSHRLERCLGVVVGEILIAMDRIGPAIVTLACVLAWLAVLVIVGAFALVFEPLKLVALGWMLWGVAALGDRLDRA